ncbi:MAG: hypothetical protein AB203_01255 [Parcubacteria bacterium C7867-008]|nr:MAG: hypothetical protein AB203_01255 [Parcubacteria bacterium C7867-008]
MAGWSSGARRVRRDNGRSHNFGLKVHTSVVRAANVPKHFIGDSSDEKRHNAVIRKALAVGDLVAFEGKPDTNHKILEVTSTWTLRLEGFPYFVSPIQVVKIN